MNGVPTCPAGVVDCEPEIRAATSSHYYLQNKKKLRNFIRAHIISHTGYLSFTVENLPKDGTGCPGWWLFEVAWNHFVQDHQITIPGIRGEWSSGDNLDTVNRLTAGNAMSLEDAAKQTWTYNQARQKGYTTYQFLDAQGSPGAYTSVDVVFLP
jgi:hypothetical protein